MGRATTRMRAFAGRLIAEETKGNKSAGMRQPAALHVVEKLRPHLATLMGSTGFHGLVSRALTLANGESRWLSKMQIREDGTLEGAGGVSAPADLREMAEGSLVLVAQLLGLLVTFIGPALTLKILGEMWPKLSLNDLDFEKGDRK